MAVGSVTFKELRPDRRAEDNLSPRKEVLREWMPQLHSLLTCWCPGA